MRLMQYAGAGVPGGLLRHVEILAAGLAASGHQVRVVLSPSPSVDPSAKACERAGAAVTRLAVRGKSDVGGFVRFRRLVARERPQVVHLHLSSPVEAMPVVLAARCGGAARVITTEHAPTWSPLEKRYSRAAKRAVGRLIVRVIALSRADASYLQHRFDVPPGRIAVIPNGVPASAVVVPRETARAGLGLRADAFPVIGYVGALEIKKGVLDLVEAVSRLAARGTISPVLALAGEGTLESQLRERSQRPGFGLHLCGQLPGVGPFLAAADLFALPSHQEAMPLALLEAMMAGLPVVATKVGGVPEAIEDGVNGLLVAPSAVDDLASALGRLAGDAELRLRLGEAARRTARERFDAKGMVRRIESLYLESVA